MPLPARLLVVLCAAAAALALPLASAQSEAYEAPRVEGEVVADGAMEGEPWSEGNRYSLRLVSNDGGAGANATLFLLQDGTALFATLQAELPEQNDGDRVRIRFVSDPGDPASGSDEWRFDGVGPGVYQDGHHANGWVVDETDAGCGLDGEGARTVSEDVAAYEFSKPFQGDRCDVAFGENATVGFQVELYEATTDRTYVFPGNATSAAASGGNDSGDTSAGNGSSWAALRLVGPTPGADDVQGPDGTFDGDPDRETRPEEGLDEDRPVRPVGPEDGPYDAAREAPALPALAAVVALGLVVWFAGRR